jgi:deazaflavin-dependent oxidoreductase (nitroreductase family)
MSAAGFAMGPDWRSAKPARVFSGPISKENGPFAAASEKAWAAGSRTIVSRSVRSSLLDASSLDLGRELLEGHRPARAAVSIGAARNTCRGDQVGQCMSDFNAKIIDEFRANAGKVGGPFDNALVLLLHTRGAKTGQERVNPVVYQALGDALAVFASKGGAPSNPDWYHNLIANPDVKVEVGTDTIDVRARVVEGEEREPIWEKQKQLMPGFAEYEQKTSRQIPVVLLEPV